MNSHSLDPIGAALPGRSLVKVGRIPVNAKLGAGGFIGGKFYIVSSGGKMAIYDVAKNSWSSGPARPGYQCPATAFATLP